MPVNTALYYATKAYVTSFTQAVAEEVRENAVTATALCPGRVATGFVAAGDLQGVGVWKNAWSAESVARCSYEAMESGERVTFNEEKLRGIFDGLVPLLPRKAVLNISRRAMEKTTR